MRDPRVPASQEVIEIIFGPAKERKFAIRYWDGTFEPAGGSSTPTFTLSFERAGAIRRMFLPPSELSVIEAYLSGDMDLQGEVEGAMNIGDTLSARLQSPGAFARLLPKLITLPTDPNPDLEQVKQRRFEPGLARLSPFRRRGGADAIQHHYDVSNEFYALWLDPRMVYTCAYFRHEDDDLATAQLAKLDHICRKLRLEQGMKLLDVGCGWGALIMHAAQNYGVQAVGITLSKRQATLGNERIAAAGLSDMCRIELRDYRDLAPNQEFDRAASVGMMEHVRQELQPGYFEAVYRVLKPGGLFMNHTIVSVARSRPPSASEWLKGKLWRRDEFVAKYVFPDGQLVPASHVVASAEGAGFELRDVESLREHYAKTARAWVAALEAHKAEAIRLVGERIFRVWRLYLTAGAYRFATGSTNLIQVLVVKPDADGRSWMPLTRDYMYEDRPLAITDIAAA